MLTPRVWAGVVLSTCLLTTACSNSETAPWGEQGAIASGGSGAAGASGGGPHFHPDDTDGGACPPPDICHLAGSYNADAGTCTPGGFVDIDDNDPCTLDTCDSLNGVVHHACSPIDRTTSTSLNGATAFLYASSDPIQTGVDASALPVTKTAVLHGTVRDAGGAAILGVAVTVAGHPEFGATVTQGNGAFQIGVNGGAPIRLHFALEGYLPVERTVASPWQDYAQADDVTMVQVDTETNAIDLDSGSYQVARGSVVTDDSGTRQAIVVVPPGTGATMTLPDGGTAALPSATIRATEYTVGSAGPSRMPGALPPTSGYTYAVELSADEAIDAGATQVNFSQPLPVYVDNFLGFPVGTTAPIGSYDATTGAWVPAASGVVLQIVGQDGSGAAEVDANGDGVADTGSALTALGITSGELQTLAATYSVGQQLWRAQVPHFTGWDINWGFGPPPDAGPPDAGDPNDDDGGSGPGDCKQQGSIIRCQRQSLGEDVALAGTPYKLHYESDRQLGRQPTLEVPLSGADLAGPVTEIDMEVDVAGQVFTQSFPPTANQTTSFTWNGQDAFGRLLQGLQPITVKVGNKYQGVYETTSSFGYNGNGTPITGNYTRQEVTLWKTWSGTVGVWDSQPMGLGGWSLDIHHAYDPAAHTVHFGDGSELTPTSFAGQGVLQAFAGNGFDDQGHALGDGGQATAATIASPPSLAIGPDGSAYIVDEQNCIRRVDAAGNITTFAGTCRSWGFSGDGGPATSALLHSPSDVAIGPDGSVYIADSRNYRVRRVDPSGNISTIAGTGTSSFSGDGGPAVSATLGWPSGVAVSPDDSVYISDQYNGRIRRVGPDGNIQTVVGVGTNGGYSVSTKGYGGPALSAHLTAPQRVRLGKDGSLYIPNDSAVDRVGPDGVFRQFAGNDDQYGFSGDGGQASQAAMKETSDCAIAPDGSVYIADGNEVIRRVTTNGIISTVVGTPDQYSPLSGLNGPPASAVLQASGTAVGPDGTLYVADPDHDQVMRVQPALPGFNDTSQIIQIASQDGTQIYIFDPTGRHLKTLDAVTGVNLYQFSYDSAGRLSIVYDANGNETQILRDGSGNPTSIVAPFGQTTTLTLDSNGYLAAITDPASDQSQFTYSAQGLMATMVDARSGLHQFSYDTAGRLTEDQDPAGGSKSLNRTEIATGGFSVAITTALGTQSTYQTTTSTTGTFSRLNTFPDGTQASLQQTSNGVITTTAADGTITTSTPTPDPRFGMESPMLSVATRTPSGLTSTSTTARSSTSSGGVLATYTEQTNLNGNIWTRLFNAGSSTWTATSPMGRQTVTTLNANGQTQQISIPNITPFTFGYDSSGHLTSVAQGTSRTWTMAYDSSSGYLTSVTDPLSHATSYLNDALGRPTVTTLPDTRTIGTAYDANGNVTVVTPPAMNAHDFGFTPVDLLASYTPPSLGTGSTETQYTYDIDRRLTNVTRPDGLTIGYGFDSAGRLSTTTYPQGVLTRGYNATTGQLASLVTPGGETLTYSYDGFLKNGLTWSGLVPGTVTFGFDSSFRMVSRSVDGNAVTLGYDTVNLLTQAGALSVSRSAQNGWVTGTTLGSISDSTTYDANGMFASYFAAYSGTALYAESVLRDAVGRITQKTETVQGTTHVWGYTYDATGRLTDVTEDGNFFSHYGYDTDDNRTTYTNASGTVNPTYDAQDRLTAYGSATYTYTANGELATKTTGSQTTTYAYDVLGNLLSVTPPSGPVISYVVDGENRRVGKESGGTLTTGFLYQDALKVVAQLDGSGSLVAQFVFGTKANVPDYFVNSSGTFRILSDHLGSPRLLVNSSTGAVAEQIDYDEFGVVMNDTSPGLTPFGFAGGLYDADTGLVRFGARDYDSSVGRWTSKDPIRFDGGMNLYGYALNDPIDRIDPDGKDSADCAVALGQEFAACLGAGFDPLLIPACLAAEQNAEQQCSGGGSAPTCNGQGNVTCSDQVGSSGCTGNPKNGLKKTCTYACPDGTQCTAFVTCKWRGDNPACPSSCTK